MNTRHLLLSLGAASMMLGAPAIASAATTGAMAPARTTATTPAKATAKATTHLHAASAAVKSKSPHR